MPITKKEAQRQFDRAIQLGWLPFFVEAAETITFGIFDAADLMGIASRETNLDPKWLTKAGDGGHGYGLMQADVRSFPDWIKSGKWKDAREGVLMGARVLMQKWQDVQDCTGKRSTVKSSRDGQTYSFIGKKVEGAEAQAVTIAAYNSGRWAHYAVSKGQHPDKYTTGRAYSADVIARASVFRGLLANKQPQPIQQLAATVQSEQPLPSNEESPVSFISDVVDKNVSPDQIKTASMTAGRRVWQVAIRPLSLLYAALEAGNVAAWLGVAVLIIAAGLLIYWHRADIKKLFDKLKAKVTQ